MISKDYVMNSHALKYCMTSYLKHTHIYDNLKYVDDSYTCIYIYHVITYSEYNHLQFYFSSSDIHSF